MKTKKAPVVKSPCPGCGRMISKRGMNGHKLTCPGPSKPASDSSTKSLSPPDAGNSTVTVSMDDRLRAAAGFKQNPMTSDLEPIPSKEEVVKKYHMDSKGWAGIFWIIGDTEDKCVDMVAARYPSEKDKLMKCNLGMTRAMEMGEMAYELAGPVKPEYVLVGYIISTFLPPLMAMIAVMLPKEYLMKFVGHMTKTTTGWLGKLKPPEKKPPQGSQDAGVSGAGP